MLEVHNKTELFTYTSRSLVPQFILLWDLVAVLVLGDILCNGMVRMRLCGISLDAHDGGWQVSLESLENVVFGGWGFSW